MAHESYQLQFGSFSTRENAETMVEELSRKGQPAQVEEISAGHTKVFRVRGGSYSEEEARLQRDKLKEMQIDAYIVNKS
jgi:cell division protein FtsN